ncbi:hypothetical protein A9Q87_05280 [Flavobacteriales bacterium 34_180_T64]|nr:hypothetical protein A9Q87_05280 [Flavobacteriales bacterium 34_180_T64]
MKIIVLLVVLSSVFSCVNEPKKAVTNTEESVEITLLDTLQLKFDRGEKWQVNDETHVGLLKMDSIIRKFKTDSQKDYVDLGELLSKQTSFVIKNCSMKGESHDQLHVVLVPMLDEISMLKESTTTSESVNALSNLESLIHNYFRHFKL